MIIRQEVAINKYIEPCFKDEKLISKGLIVTMTPNTKRILAIFEPTILPKTIAPSPLKIAITLTTNSGKLVPKAITVSPITIGEIFKLRAMSVELSINNEEP